MAIKNKKQVEQWVSQSEGNSKLSDKKSAKKAIFALQARNLKYPVSQMKEIDRKKNSDTASKLI